MIQRMSESFEERTVETSKENLELIKIQNHLQDEIKGLYKLLIKLFKGFDTYFC